MSEKEELRKTLEKVEATLRPWIGMADPKRYGWVTRMFIWTTSYPSTEETKAADARFSAMKKELASKGFHFETEMGADGYGFSLSSNGLFVPLKKLPASAMEFLCEFSITFQKRDNYDNQFTDFLVTPIEVRISAKQIDYRFGDGTVWFYGNRTKAEIMQLVRRDIYDAYLYDLQNGNRFFEQYAIFINGNGGTRLCDLEKVKPEYRIY